MTTLPLRHPSEAQRLLLGWGLSLLVHGLAAAAAYVLVADLRLVPQPEPFRWEVTMVEAPPPTRAEPAEPAGGDPARLVAAPSAPPLAPQPALSRQAVETVPAVRPVEPMQTLERIEPVVRELVRQELRPVQPVIQAAQAAPTVQPVEANRAVSRPVEALPLHPEPAPQVRDTRTGAAVIADPVQATVREVTPVAAREVPKPITKPAEAAAPVEPAVPLVSAAAPSPVVSRPLTDVTPLTAPVQAHERARGAQEAIAKLAPSAGSGSPGGERVASAQPAARTDFGWLADALLNRVHQLKRYPFEARMKRLEGRVVIRVVIREDGNLEDLTVVQSSGHQILDHDAVEIIRQASPLPLARPLGRPQVVVQVPISYRLKP
ncbi:TonB family protein [Nitrospira sp. Kam-Ns4a]